MGGVTGLSVVRTPVDLIAAGVPRSVTGAEERGELAIRSGFGVEVEGFIPHGCKRFAINLGKDAKNLVIHFDVRFDHLGDQGKIVMNSVKDGVHGKELREGFFPFQMGSDTKIVFQFETDKITVRLPAGSPISFPIRFPITDITFVSVEELESKSITLK